MVANRTDQKDRPRVRILIADDNPHVRRELRTLLPLAGDIEIAGETGAFFSRPGAILTWCLPFALVLGLVDPLGLLRPGPPEYMARLFVYPIFVLLGFLIFADERVQAAIARQGQRRSSLGMALALTLAAAPVMEYVTDHTGPVVYWGGMILAALLIWSWLLAILGYGLKYLNVNHRVLPYANEAVLPFYILHQPLILLVGYLVIPLPLPILGKYVMIAVVALGLTLGLYEFGIRRVSVIRRIFGMKARAKEPAVTRVAAPAA